MLISTVVVLDSSLGKPAAGVDVTVYSIDPVNAHVLEPYANGYEILD